MEPRKDLVTARLDMGKDLVAASATPLVLAILAGGDSYGYAIIKRVNELSHGRLQWTDGMLYPVLHRLERQAMWRRRGVSPRTGGSASTTASPKRAGPSWRPSSDSGRWWTTRCEASG